MGITPVTGLPGVRAPVTSAYRLLFKQFEPTYLAGGKIIDSSSRDMGNSPDVMALRAGLLMGKITASGKYAPSFIDVTAGAIVAGATSLTLSAAGAVELARRVGATGTFNLSGPPGAGGIIQRETVTYSAINTTTGVVTVTATANPYVAGALVGGTDGSQVPITFIPDGYPTLMDGGGGVAIDQPFPKVPVAGIIVSKQILPAWPTDVSLQNYIKSCLSNLGGGKYVFDDGF